MNKLTIALIILSFGAGATDAFAFLLLGGIFTANMTGNLILVGLVQRPDYLATLLGASVAIIVFIGALLIAFRLTVRRNGDDAHGPHPRVLRLLALAAAAQTIVLLAWVALGGQAALAPQVVLVALSAVAMATQTVVSKRVSSMSGVTTTYVTGTLTSVMQDIAEGKTGGRAVRIVSVLALVAGAFAGAVSIVLSPTLGPVVPWLALVAATAITIPAVRQARAQHTARSV
ncbi:YoaK family protein [soil metagenome]